MNPYNRRFRFTRKTFLILLAVRRTKKFNGQVLATWLMLYAILRFVVEFFRGDDIRNFWFKYPDELHPLILSTSQGIAVGLFAVGFALVALYGRKPKASQPASPA